MPRRLAQQQMTLSDLECLKSTSSASRAISTLAELLVHLVVHFIRQYFKRSVMVVMLPYLVLPVIRHAATLSTD